MSEAIANVINAPADDSAIFRIIWGRDNGRRVPRSFHVLISVVAVDADAAKALYLRDNPGVPADEIVAVDAAHAEELLADAHAAAIHKAQEEEFDAIALAEQTRVEQAAQQQAEQQAKAKTDTERSAVRAQQLEAARQRLAAMTQR